MLYGTIRETTAVFVNTPVVEKPKWLKIALNKSLLRKNMDLSVLGLTKEIKFRLWVCDFVCRGIHRIYYYDLTRSFLIILKEFVMNLG